MKPFSLLAGLIGAWFLAGTSFSAVAQPSPGSLIYETATEFFGRGDFDGDGRDDLVIVDKPTGKFRLGYQLSPGQFNWVDNRPTGIKEVSGFSIGKLLDTNHDALVFTAPDANQITMTDASRPTAPSRPVTVPFTAGLGPNALVAVDIGGDGNTSLADLFVGSIYNSPEPSQVALLRNDGKEFPKLAEEVVPGPVTRANHLAFKTGQPEMVCELVTGEKGDTFRIERAKDGKPVLELTEEGLAAGSEYAVGRFGKSPLPEFIFYKPGEKKLSARPVEASANGKLQLGKGSSFDLQDAIGRIVSLEEGLFVIFGNGEKGGIFAFDGEKAPRLIQTLVSTNELLTWAANLPQGLIAFSHPSSSKFSTRYQIYKRNGAEYAFAVFGGLASLAENDNITIPDIHDRITGLPNSSDAAEMKAYTNTIPGTRATYAMVPIPGGEFVMGSPADEKGRKLDEGPQHKVKISPFWMGQCEVTWNEYELYMYHDEEVRTRETIPTDASGDKLADAVTHPSKPYVEMSFGMGKDGFPAIAMTQHGANKYCQWLSAKTGQFYRLPTEAEWEYACRAGTTTTFFFGNDVSQLGEYAWFEQNSDFKYQKVGKKKPNPWGLYDMYGNVVEWVLDQYDANYYADSASKGVVSDPWNKATKPYPHGARGGSWDDEALKCRSAARRGSDRSWKMQDPQLPKSVWYFSDAQFVGFRIVRPLKVPPPEEMQKYWTSGVERD